MTEQELRSKVFEYAEYFTDMDRPEPGQDGWYIAWESKMDGLMALITQYGDTREREGRIDELQNLLQASIVAQNKAFDPLSGVGRLSDVPDRLAELKEEV